MIKLVLLVKRKKMIKERVIKLSDTDFQLFMQLNYDETEDLIKERYIANFDKLISFEWRYFNEDV